MKKFNSKLTATFGNQHNWFKENAEETIHVEKCYTQRLYQW